MNVLVGNALLGKQQPNLALQCYNSAIRMLDTTAAPAAQRGTAAPAEHRLLLIGALLGVHAAATQLGQAALADKATARAAHAAAPTNPFV